MPYFTSFHASLTSKSRTTESAATCKGTCAGSSLLEFILSLAVATALALLSVPQLNALTDRGYFSRKCRALKPALELGRVTALVLGQPIEVKLEETRLIGLVPAQNRMVFGVDLPKGQAEIASSVHGKIIFRPNLSATPSSIRITGSSRLCHIRVSLRGRIIASAL